MTKEMAKKGEGERASSQENREGKQFEPSDWSLIKSNVTALLDFPTTTRCTLLPFDDKIITNSTAQYFPQTHSRMHKKWAAFFLRYIHLTQ